MANPFVPDMTMDWRPGPVVSPSYPQQRTLPTWGAIGTPSQPGAAYDPNTPLAKARKLAGFGSLFGTEENAYTRFRNEHPMAALALKLVGIAGTGIGAYHGYKRNRGSVGWAFVWSLCGTFFPIFVIPIAFAQGLGKPASR